MANIFGRTRAGRQEILDNCRALDEATPLPVSADLENGFADDPAGVAKMIEMSYQSGAVGASIEDHTADRRAPIYDFKLSVDRVRAAVEAARALPIPFVLTARAENLLYGINNLDDTVKRLRAFEDAGPTCCTHRDFAPWTRSARWSRRWASLSAS